MTVQTSAALLFAIILHGHMLPEGKVWYETKSFYIRHHSGKCVDYNPVRNALVYVEICREKFHWSAGAQLVHVPTKRCVTVSSTAENSLISLTSQCSDTKTLFRYDKVNHVLVHLISGKCLHPETEADNPTPNSTVVLKQGCKKMRYKYYFRPDAHYIIRHFGGLCWVHSAAENMFKLERHMVCDRFHYENDYKLKHVNTGKCITSGGSYILQLTDDCSGTQSHLYLNAYSNIGNPLSACVHPHIPVEAPSSGVHLVLWPNGCNDANGVRFYFYDDTDILKVKIQSQNCQVEDCTDPKGQVVINGFRRNNDWSGILFFVFDYRSGIREDMRWYDLAQSREVNAQFVSRLRNVGSGKIIFFASRGKVNQTLDSATTLRRYGVAAGFASINTNRPYASMATIAYTGNEQKSWEKSLYSKDGEGLVIETSIHRFRDLDGEDDCTQELGIRTGKIPDSRFTASSVWRNEAANMPFRARLHEKRYNGWCSAEGSPLSHYIQVDLGALKELSGLALQGGYNGSRYLKTYSIEYSSDGVKWQFYRKPGQDDRMIMPGLNGGGSGETRINWLEVNIVARYVRIVPSSRNSDRSCVRFDLFGCAHKTIFMDSSFNNLTFKPLQRINKSLSVYAVVPNRTAVIIGISSAASNESLAQNIDQFHISKLDGMRRTAARDVRTEDTGRNTSQPNRVKIASSGTLTFGIGIEDYYKYDVNISLQVMDPQQASGNAVTIISFEATDGITVICKQNNFQRLPKDRSYAQMKISDASNEVLYEGGTMHFNISVFHTNSGEEESKSNAYNVEVFVYYDSYNLEVMSVDSVIEQYWDIAPTRNVTRPGLVYLQTNLLSFHNKQAVSVTLKMKSVKQELKGSKWDGAVLIDFGYMSNLLKFQGTFNKTSKIINYKCKTNESNKEEIMSKNYHAPKFTMVYDEVNGFFFFCFQRKQYTNRNSPNCYWQRNGKSAWEGVSEIAAVLGIDTNNKILYGISRDGIAHLRASYPFNVLYHIDYSTWVSAKSKLAMRHSIKVNDPSTMPTTITQQLTISIAGVDLWAATSTNIMKKYGLIWRKVVQL